MKLHSGIGQGKYVILDIGSDSTKILEVNMKESYCRVINSAIFRDMSSFAQSRKLINIEEFTASIVEFMKKKGITSHNLLITSSICDIGGEIRNLLADKPRAIAACVEAEITRSISNNYHFQWYGDIIDEDKSKASTVTAQCNTRLLEALAQGFRHLGFKISSVEGQWTANYNLVRMFPSSYDTDCMIFIEIGHHSKAYVAIEDKPSKVDNFSINFTDFVRNLAIDLGINILKVRQALQSVGFIDNPDNQSKLIDLGISEYNDYFRALREFVPVMADEITKYISDRRNGSKLHGELVILCGGYCEVPGFTELLQEKVSIVNLIVFNLETNFENELVRISNQTGRDIGPIFSSCIGVMLKLGFKYHMNLFAEADQLKYIDLRINQILRYVYVIPVIILFIGIANFILRGASFAEDLISSKSIANHISDVAVLENEVKSKTVAMKTMGKSDKTFQPVMNYIADNQGIQIKIASVDTDNLLAKTEGTLSGVTVNGTTSSASTTASIASGSASGTAQKNSSSSQISKSYSELIIRGYATNTTAFTGFFLGLNKLSCINGNASIQLEQQQALPSGESVLVFEIEVSING